MTLSDLQSLTTALVRDDAGNIATPDRAGGEPLQQRPAAGAGRGSGLGRQIQQLAGWEAGAGDCRQGYLQCPEG